MQKNNKNIYTIIIIVLVTLLLMVICWQGYRYFKAKTAQVPNLYFDAPTDIPDTTFAAPTYLGEQINTPRQLPILSIERESRESLYGFLDDYCQVTSTSDDYHIGTMCTYQTTEPEFTLVITNNTDTQYTPADPQKLEEAANNYLSTIYDKPELQLTSSEIEYAENYEEAIVEPEVDELAQYVEDGLNDPMFDLGYSDEDGTEELVDEYGMDAVIYSLFIYTPHYNGYNVYTRDGIAAEVVIDVNSSYEVTTAKIITELPYFSVYRNYDIINIDTALANIGNDNAYLVSYGIVDPDEAANLTNIKLTEVSLEYRMNDEQTEAIPCYHFIGTANDVNGNELYVEIVTPAIRFEVV